MTEGGFRPKSPKGLPLPAAVERTLVSRDGDPSSNTPHGRSPLRFDMGAPIESARTLPVVAYTDGSLTRAEHDAAFLPSFQFVAHRSQLSAPGAFVTTDTVFGPVLLSCGADGLIRAFRNVCRHRAARVETRAAGSARAFSCPYHGWTYDLDGRLRLVPEAPNGDALCREERGLVPLDLQAWGPWLFVRLKRNPMPLDAFLDGLAQVESSHAWEDYVWAERREYTVECNWKVYVDNYLDGGYHVNPVHPELGKALDYPAYTTEVFVRSSVQRAPLRSAGKALARRGDEARYHWVYPNFMLNVYEGVVDTNVVIPLTESRCKVVFDFYFARNTSAGADPAKDAESIRRSLEVAEKVQQEDMAICEDVQRGLGTGAWESGRFCARREAGVLHFHRLVATDMERTLVRP
jgi:choline monooxygenase